MSDYNQRPDNEHNFDDEAAYVEAESIDEPVVDPHEPIVDAGDAPGEEAKAEGHDKLEKATVELNQLGENLARAAADAAYATIGLVGLVSDRVKEFYADQKKHYADEHPDLEGEPEAKHVISRFGEQVDRFVGDIGTTIRDLADRGRASSKVAAEDAADKAADLADKAAAKAADLADKADEGAHRAADKFGDSAQRAADAFGEKAESASERVDDVVEDAADKADDPRLRDQW